MEIANMKSLGSTPLLWDSRANSGIQIKLLFSVNGRNINTGGVLAFSNRFHIKA